LTREALKDSDNEVRQAAIRALADWPDSSALESLIALAQEQGSRARTLRGFIRLVRADPKRNEAETVALYRQAWPLAGTDERQMILSGLGDLKGPEALVMAAEGLDDSAVKTEAIASVLRIARAAASNYPADVRKTIERLLKTSLDPKIKAEGEAILSSLP
jgi:HEAT repeat protein